MDTVKLLLETISSEIERLELDYSIRDIDLQTVKHVIEVLKGINK